MPRYPTDPFALEFQTGLSPVLRRQRFRARHERRCPLIVVRLPASKRPDASRRARRKRKTVGSNCRAKAAFPESCVETFRCGEVCADELSEMPWSPPCWEVESLTRLRLRCEVLADRGRQCRSGVFARFHDYLETKLSCSRRSNRSDGSGLRTRLRLADHLDKVGRGAGAGERNQIVAGGFQSIAPPLDSRASR